jgi:SAM domain (Sterile alpha motif)
VKEWLKAIQFEHYWDAFRGAGFDMLETLAHLTDEVLKDVLEIAIVGHHLLLLT